MRKKGLIADSIHGSVELTAFERKVMSHVAFNRLHDVYQNSTVYLTFPCNRTKRFEHSIGTMKLCSDVFSSAIWNSDLEIRENFIDCYIVKLEEIIKEIKNNRSKYCEYDNAFGGRINLMTESLPVIDSEFAAFESPFSTSDKKYSAYFVLLQAVRVAGLLHDIGHPPYSHITEYALENLKNTFKESENDKRIDDFNNIMNSFFENNKEKKLHEQMGDRITSIILADSIETITSEVANTDTKTYNMQIIKVLIKEVVQKIFNNVEPFDCLHRIIDGTLDGDRMDYVTRDPLNSGLDKGKIEYDRLCKGMVIAKKDAQFWFVPSLKSLNTVEDFLNRRWDLYKGIIFHHRVVKTDYILQNVIYGIATDFLQGNIEDDVSGNVDLLPENISGLWYALRSNTNLESSYAISQWDDSWLMTVLKKHYFKNYINRNDNVITKQLEELLTSRKNYFSVIKRLEDFLIIDIAISKAIVGYSTELIEKQEELIKLSEDFEGSQKDLNESKEKIEAEKKSNYFSVDQVLDDLNDIIKVAKLSCDSEVFYSLIFSQLRKNYVFSKDKEDISKLVKRAVEQSRKDNLTNYVDDVFVVIKNYDIGLKKPLFLYDEKSGNLVSIHKVSSVAKVLNLNYERFPQFFIYILKKREYQNQRIDLDKFLNDIGKYIAKEFYKKWIDILDQSIKKYKDEKENRKNV